MIKTKRKKFGLLPMSRVRPRKEEADGMDTVAFSARERGARRAFDVLMEAQHYWNQMDQFRKDRERNKRYTYGDQWGDLICVDGKHMTEEEFKETMLGLNRELAELNNEAKELEAQIAENIKALFGE